MSQRMWRYSQQTLSYDRLPGLRQTLEMPGASDGWEEERTLMSGHHALQNCNSRPPDWSDAPPGLCIAQPQCLARKVDVGPPEGLDFATPAAGQCDQPDGLGRLPAHAGSFCRS